MNIATPEWAIVNVDGKFIASNPSVHISLRHSSISISEGQHFGSRMGNLGLTNTYDGSLADVSDKVANLDDIIKVVVSDV
jgi:hypothetical protein